VAFQKGPVHDEWNYHRLPFRVFMIVRNSATVRDVHFRQRVGLLGIWTTYMRMELSPSTKTFLLVELYLLGLEL